MIVHRVALLASCLAGSDARAEVDGDITWRQYMLEACGESTCDVPLGVVWVHGQVWDGQAWNQDHVEHWYWSQDAAVNQLARDGGLQLRLHQILKKREDPPADPCAGVTAGECWTWTVQGMGLEYVESVALTGPDLWGNAGNDDPCEGEPWTCHPTNTVYLKAIRDISGALTSTRWVAPGSAWERVLFTSSSTVGAIVRLEPRSSMAVVGSNSAVREDPVAN